MSEHVKLLFVIDGPAVGSTDVESLWACRRGEGFALDNIPFYAREVAVGDIVAARKDADGALWFDGLITPSGHSTVRLWFARSDDVAAMRERLRALGCPSELSELSRLVAVDIPPSVGYGDVKNLLDDAERNGLLEYEEACLGLNTGL